MYMEYYYFHCQTMESNQSSNKQHQMTIATLRSIPILKALSQDQINKLAKLMSTREFKKNEKIITQGDEPDGFYIIRKVAHARITGLGWACE